MRNEEGRHGQFESRGVYRRLQSRDGCTKSRALGMPTEVQFGAADLRLASSQA